MTTTCNTDTNCNAGFPGSFEVNGNFVMNEGSTLHLNMCCDDDGNSSSGGSNSGTDKFLVSGALNTAGHLILTMNDNSTIDCGLLSGSGNPVVSALVNGSGELVLTLQDGSQINAGVVFNGTSNPVVSAAINANNELILTLQDNTEINAGQIAVPESKGFVVSDAAMVAGNIIEKNLSKTQTAYDLQAYALKQEVTGSEVESSLVVQAETPTQDIEATNTENLTPSASGNLFTATPSEFGAMSIRSSGSIGANIVQPMTSNNSAGQIASASSIYHNNAYQPWEAFNGTNNDENDCWYHSGGSEDEWLAIEFSEPKTIAGYSLQNRNYATVVPITDWTLQGSNDGTVWNDLHTGNEPDYEGSPRAIREYNDIGTFTYKHFRLYVREGIAVANWELFAPGTGLLLESGGNYYTVSSGSLTPVALPADTDAVMNTGFADSGTISSAELTGKTPFNIVASSTDVVTVTLYDAQYESIAATETDISSYSQLHSVNFDVSTAQILVKKDGIHYSWSGSEWQTHGAGLSSGGGNAVVPMTANTDSASGQSVTASSEYGGAYAIYKAFNGTSDGYNDSWLSATYPTESSPEWIAIDLGETKAITGYEIRNQEYSQPYSAKNWTLQGSHNGTDWDVLHTVTDNVDNNSAGLRSFLNIGVFAYQHYRLHVTDGNAGSAYVSFSDIRLIGETYDIATDGNTVAELEALTAADWAKLYPSGLTNIAFSYQSAEDLTGATATVYFNTGGSGSETDAWMLCDASEVRIRWYEDKVTFTAAQDGNYKLAYQDAA